MTVVTASNPVARPRETAGAVVLLLLVGLAYLPVVRAGWVWDDDAYVTSNLSLRSAEGLRRIWFEPTSRLMPPQYYPLTHTVLWLEYRLWGLDAVGYHVLNVVLHALTALLLWRLLASLGVPGAWVAAAAWAVHPVMVESVAWVSELKNVLSGTFYVAAALAYRRATTGAHRWGWYAAGFGLFACALLGKTVACTLPAALLLLVWWERGRIRARDVVPLVPFFVAAAALGSVTAWMERHLVGATGSEWHLTPADRILIAGRALWFYAAKLLWPAGLAFNYERWQIDPANALQWLFPAAAAAAVALLFVARRRIGRGPVTAVLFFVVTLTPALGFFDVYPMRYAFVADHFQYVASAGIVALVVGAATTAPRLRRLRPALATAVLASLAALTWVRATTFRDSETLWRDTLAKNPGSWLAHTTLTRTYLATGDPAMAVREAEAAVALRPDDAGVRSWLGLALTATGRKEEARAAHERAVELDPEAAVAHYNYGCDLERWGETASAEARYRTAIALDPEALYGSRTRLGHLLAARGERSEAIDLYRQELTLVPESPTAAQNLAESLLAVGEGPEAERVLTGLLAVDPGDAKARNMLAIALMGRHDVAGAERESQQAVRDDPDLAEARNTLGAVLAAEGRLDEAIAEYREALRLRPDYEHARTNLEAALAVREEAAH
jgi:tetratricopeptide (TPR) repeat protein